MAQEKTLQETAQIRQEQLESSKGKANPKGIHSRLVSKRFKELRKEGHDAKTAMAMLWAEYGL